MMTRLLVRYLKPQWHRSALLAALLLLSIALQLLNPQILKNFIDSATRGSLSTSLLILGALFAGIALINAALSVVTNYLSTDVAWRTTNRLRRDLLSHCLELDLGYHKAHTPGEMIERIDGDVDKLSNFFSQMVVQFLSSAILLAAILILFFTISWLIGIAMVVYTSIALLILLYVRRRSLPLMECNRQMSAEFYGFLGERLGGSEDIRANGAIDYIMRRFLLERRRWFPILRKSYQAFALMFSSAFILFACGSMLALVLGVYLWSSRAISLGTVFLIFSYTGLLNYPLRQIQTQLQDLQQAGACVKRVGDLLDVRSALRDEAKLTIERGPLPVEMRNVTFGYVADEPVLHNVSFAVAPGKVLGIVGRTGSGKTTLGRLLFRLYDPQEGEILVGGVPVREVGLRDLRRQVGLVTQDVQIFHASVRDNLTFFDRCVPDERILAVLNDVGLDTWHNSLPNGLDTILGSEGEGLSAGEAQLLAFTRVFLREPGLVILDEASSRLDPATERRIEHAMDKLLSGRTAIVIAHRLATLQRAYDILLIENGRVVEYGNRAALANDARSRFSSLLRTGSETLSEA